MNDGLRFALTRQLEEVVAKETMKAGVLLPRTSTYFIDGREVSRSTFEREQRRVCIATATIDGAVDVYNQFIGKIPGYIQQPTEKNIIVQYGVLPFYKKSASQQTLQTA